MELRIIRLGSVCFFEAFNGDILWPKHIIPPNKTFTQHIDNLKIFI
ncbi:hypothetical protein NY78_4361 [Desulfovibrio sp. TomC]|nr:hypothetical protein NY78_4361 [Desulfovibrio sp. TomC]